MKKITEYIPISKDIKLSDLPLDNCLFSDEKNQDWSRVDSIKKLIGVAEKDEPFLSFRKGFSDCWWKYCVQVKKRYPREVPADVKPLPNKPFLAYVGIGWETEESKNPDYDLWCFIHKEWRRGTMPKHEYLHYAINVSSELARKKFPKLVEAMEYEPIYRYIDDGNGVHGLCLVGHKLGDKKYDLRWKLLEVAKKGIQWEFETLDEFLDRSKNDINLPPVVDLLKIKKLKNLRKASKVLTSSTLSIVKEVWDAAREIKETEVEE